MQEIILTHGYTCSLKSTISEALAARTGLQRIETKQFGKIKSERQKMLRYEGLAKAAGNVLEAGQSVILDGTFPTFECRNRIYRLAEKHGVSRVTVLHCVCADDEEVLRRLFARKKNEGVCYEEWLNRAHEGLEADMERFGGLRVVRIDTSGSVALPYLRETGAFYADAAA
mgnify:CR=1 FL=1